jgi:hypothetical protein
MSGNVKRLQLGRFESADQLPRIRFKPTACGGCRTHLISESSVVSCDPAWGEFGGERTQNTESRRWNESQLSYAAEQRPYLGNPKREDLTHELWIEAVEEQRGS